MQYFKNKSKEYFLNAFPFGENMLIFCYLGTENYIII